MWIAIDPDRPRRRVAFGNEQSARLHAEGLTPAWTVLPAEDPRIVPITGVWPDDAAQKLPRTR